CAIHGLCRVEGVEALSDACGDAGRDGARRRHLRDEGLRASRLEGGSRPARTCVRTRLLFLIHSRKCGTLPDVPTTSDFERMLRGVELRVTRPRVAVLSAVHDHPHADTDS